MTHGEFRAQLSSIIDFQEARSHLADNMQLPPPLTVAATAALFQATPDALHQWIETMGRAHHHASFVNDTATAVSWVLTYSSTLRMVMVVLPRLTPQNSNLC
jgi:hypothetical protein